MIGLVFSFSCCVGMLSSSVVLSVFPDVLPRGSHGGSRDAGSDGAVEGTLVCSLHMGLVDAALVECFGDDFLDLIASFSEGAIWMRMSPDSRVPAKESFSSIV